MLYLSFFLFFEVTWRDVAALFRLINHWEPYAVLCAWVLCLCLCVCVCQWSSLQLFFWEYADMMQCIIFSFSWLGGLQWVVLLKKNSTLTELQGSMLSSFTMISAWISIPHGILTFLTISCVYEVWLTISRGMMNVDIKFNKTSPELWKCNGHFRRNRTSC